ncbi:MAG: VOC family protein [Candidatus Methanomethylophilaceae archaeon]|nr:VOC family protein [Candidatus Methanomethylophilaceae archaeon]
MNRINVICLGVRDMPRSIRFYRDGLGFQTDEEGDEPRVVFFDSTGTKLELYPLHLLAQDIDPEDPPRITDGFAGMTLAYNVRSKEEVKEVVEKARSAGAKVVKEPQDAFWGGHHAYFSDPDGYYWEVAWGPGFAFDDEDMLVLPL